MIFERLEPQEGMSIYCSYPGLLEPEDMPEELRAHWKEVPQQVRERMHTDWDICVTQLCSPAEILQAVQGELPKDSGFLELFAEGAPQAVQYLPLWKAGTTPMQPGEHLVLLNVLPQEHQLLGRMAQTDGMPWLAVAAFADGQGRLCLWCCQPYSVMEGEQPAIPRQQRVLQQQWEQRYEELFPVRLTVDGQEWQREEEQWLYSMDRGRGRMLHGWAVQEGLLPQEWQAGHTAWTLACYRGEGLHLPISRITAHYGNYRRRIFPQIPVTVTQQGGQELCFAGADGTQRKVYLGGIVLDDLWTRLRAQLEQFPQERREQARQNMLSVCPEGKVLAMLRYEYTGDRQEQLEWGRPARLDGLEPETGGGTTGWLIWDKDSEQGPHHLPWRYEMLGVVEPDFSGTVERELFACSWPQQRKGTQQLLE